MKKCEQCGGPLGLLNGWLKLYKLPFKMAFGNTAMLPVCRKCYLEQTQPKRTSGNASGAMVLFLFNSDNPPADATTSYGAFSETALLKHLFASWDKTTGDEIGKTELKGCHGDLFEKHLLGDSACTLHKLGKMMRSENLDGSLLRTEFDAAVRKGNSVGFIPWAVGLSPVPDAVARAVHEALKAELPDFYLGVLSLPPSHQFEPTASDLALPQTMRIRKGQLVGDWQGKAP